MRCISFFLLVSLPLFAFSAQVAFKPSMKTSTGGSDLRLITLRHGTTHATAKGTVQGNRNTKLEHLNDVGHREAHIAAQQLRGGTVHEIVTDGLHRTRQTAAYVQELHPKAKLRIDERLRGVGMGEGEGRPYHASEFAAGKDWRASPKYKGAESDAAFKGRVRGALSDLLQPPSPKSASHTRVVVSHAHPIRDMIGTLHEEGRASISAGVDVSADHKTAALSHISVRDPHTLLDRNGKADWKKARPGQIHIDKVAWKLQSKL